MKNVNLMPKTADCNNLDDNNINTLISRKENQTVLEDSQLSCRLIAFIFYSLHMCQNHTDNDTWMDICTTLTVKVCSKVHC